MIVYRSWKRSRAGMIDMCAHWDGWFLFGIIPLYVRLHDYTVVRRGGR